MRRTGTSPRGALRHVLGRFLRHETGSGAVEAVIILPALAAIYCACFVWFDAARNNTLALKATYTIADILSRESQVDDEDLSELGDLLAYLVPSTVDPQIRVSVITYNDDVDEDNKYRLKWSFAEGLSELEQTDLDGDTSWIPAMSDDDTIIVTESRVRYNPLFNVGWSDPVVWYNEMVVRPRFVGILKNTDRPDDANSIDDTDNEGDGDLATDLDDAS